MILRREALYSSQIVNWLRVRDVGALAGPSRSHARVLMRRLTVAQICEGGRSACRCCAVMPRAHSVGAMVNSAPAGRLRWVCPGEPNAIDEPNFGLALRRMRLNAGLSQRELAERIGSTQSAVARMEKGEAEPKFCTLEKLAAALGQDLFVHVRAVEQK